VGTLGDRYCLRRGSALNGTRLFALLFPPFLVIVIFGLCLSFDARAADEPSVGMVTKVENEAEVLSGGSSTTAAIGTVLHMKDELRTGADGRLQVTFRDKSVLTLGEKASVVIDRYVFDPDAGAGEAALDAAKGAFRFATGRLGSLRDKKITVSTPVAQIGVRGTEFWGGMLGQKYGILLLKPAITVTNQAGSVTLNKPGWGTDILSNTDVPGPPTKWAADKVASALGSTSTQPGPNPHGPTQHGPIHHGGNNPGSPNPNYAVTPNPVLGAAAIAGVVTGIVVTTDEHRTDEHRHEKPPSPKPASP
jgi:FecR protein